MLELSLKFSLKWYDLVLADIIYITNRIHLKNDKAESLYQKVPGAYWNVQEKYSQSHEFLWEKLFQKVNNLRQHSGKSIVLSIKEREAPNVNRFHFPDPTGVVTYHLAALTFGATTAPVLIDSTFGSCCSLGKFFGTAALQSMDGSCWSVGGSLLASGFYAWSGKKFFFC